jgi:hypothetical protein
MAMTPIARRIERLEVASGVEPIEIIILRFGGGPVDPTPRGIPLADRPADHRHPREGSPMTGNLGRRLERLEADQATELPRICVVEIDGSEERWWGGVRPQPGDRVFELVIVDRPAWDAAA